MISVEKVSKYYGAHRAVTDLSFEIGDGECVGFLGLNGAGKSTTLRLLSCLLLPTSGRVTVRGLDVVAHPHEIRRFIGYLPESPPLYMEMTVKEYLTFAGHVRGLSGAELDKGRARSIELCNVGDVAHKIIGTLSHGYRQRVGIAQAIIHGPSLLILDEPIQGLDPVQIVDMRNMIKALRGEHTVLLSTHILTEIEHTCDRILMMHEGRLAAQGSEEQLAAKLSSSRKLEVEVRGTEESLRGALAAVAAVSELEISGKGKGEGILLAKLQVADADREQVSRALVQAGLGLLTMRLVSTGLEAVFIQLSSGAASGPSSETRTGSETDADSGVGE